MQQMEAKSVLCIFVVTIFSVIAQDLGPANNGTIANNTTSTNTTTNNVSNPSPFTGPSNMTNTCSGNQTMEESGYDCLTCKNTNAECNLIYGKKCYCISMDYVRTPDNRCILPQDCTPQDKCSKNEYPAKRGYDQLTCNNLNSTIPLTKQEKCYCINGYVRNRDGNCIRIADCPPPNAKECPVNQTYSDRGGFDCLTCMNPDAPCALNNLAGCYCLAGYVRDYGKCILPENCPNQDGKNVPQDTTYIDLNCLNPEMIGCANTCVKTCQYWQPMRPFCTPACVKQLRNCCPVGQVLDKMSKKCVRKVDCYKYDPYNFSFF